MSAEHAPTAAAAGTDADCPKARAHPCGVSQGFQGVYGWHRAANRACGGRTAADCRKAWAEQLLGLSIFSKR